MAATETRPQPHRPTDAEVLTLAAKVLERQARERAALVRVLVRRYCSGRADAPHEVGRPRRLSPEETLVLFALERNGYVVSAEASPGGRWFGEASCRFGVQDTALVMRAVGRLEVLWGLWAIVSDQGEVDDWGVQVAGVRLTTADLEGAVRQRHLRELRTEARQEDVRVG